MENNKDKQIEYIQEEYIQVSEIRIKNTIKEYKRGLPFNGVLSSSFSCMISFFIAFASYSSNSIPWKWIFLSLSIISTIIFVIFGIIALVKKRIGRGTEKWFLEEIKNNHPSRHYKKSHVNSKLLFNIVNITLIIGIPISVLLIVLGCNDWNLSGKDWSTIFWPLWIMGTIIWLTFGTFVNAYFAYLLFGYDDGFPDVFL